MQHFKFVNWRIKEFVFWCHERVNKYIWNKRVSREQKIDVKKIMYKRVNRTMKLWVEQTDKSNPFHKCLHVTKAFKRCTPFQILDYIDFHVETMNILHQLYHVIIIIKFVNYQFLCHHLFKDCTNFILKWCCYWINY